MLNASEEKRVHAGSICLLYTSVSDKAEEIRQALLRYAQDAEIVYDGAKKLLLEELPPEPEATPAVPENLRHPKKKKAGPALRCVGVRGTSGKEYRADAVLVATGGVSYQMCIRDSKCISALSVKASGFDGEGFLFIKCV